MVTIFDLRGWMHHWTNTIGLMFLASLCPAGSSANGGAEARPLFTDDATMIVRIEAPFTTIMRDRSETEYHDGSYVFLDVSGNERRLDVGLRTRGEYRRRKDVCNFAPLRLNFRRKQVEGTEFSGQDKLKMVTHCRSGRKKFQRYVLKEYLAYQILETLTERSYRTRLLQVTYVDTDRKNRKTTRYAFLIEPKKHVGDRLGWKLVDAPRIKYSELDRAQANLIAVYEYFIGNTDFSMVLGAIDDSCCHNITLYSATKGTYMPVPYDFDLAGIVNAPYATPNPKYKLKSVLERLYLGQCANNELLETTLAIFEDKEQELRQLVKEQEGLSIFGRRPVRQYIREFYEDFESARALQKNFLGDCF